MNCLGGLSTCQPRKGIPVARPRRLLRAQSNHKIRKRGSKVFSRTLKLFSGFSRRPEPLAKRVSSCNEIHLRFTDHEWESIGATIKRFKLFRGYQNGKRNETGKESRHSKKPRRSAKDATARESGKALRNKSESTEKRTNMNYRSIAIPTRPQTSSIPMLENLGRQKLSDGW